MLAENPEVLSLEARNDLGAEVASGYVTLYMWSETKDAHEKVGWYASKGNDRTL